MADNTHVGTMAEQDQRRAERKQAVVKAEQDKYTGDGMIVPRAQRRGMAEVDLKHDPTLAAKPEYTESGGRGRKRAAPVVNFGLGDQYLALAAAEAPRKEKVAEPSAKKAAKPSAKKAAKLSAKK